LELIEVLWKKMLEFIGIDFLVCWTWWTMACYPSTVGSRR